MLVTAAGVIKISSYALVSVFRLANGTAAGYETPRLDPTRREVSDVLAVGYIATELMQKAPQENQRVGLEHPELWPKDATDFLTATTDITITSVAELSKVSRAPVAGTGEADAGRNRSFPVVVSQPGSNGSTM